MAVSYLRAAGGEHIDGDHSQHSHCGRQQQGARAWLGDGAVQSRDDAVRAELRQALRVTMYLLRASNIMCHIYNTPKFQVN